MLLLWPQHQLKVVAHTAVGEAEKVLDLVTGTGQLERWVHPYGDASRAQNSDKDSAVQGESRIRRTSCLLYTSPSPRDLSTALMPASA